MKREGKSAIVLTAMGIAASFYLMVASSAAQGTAPTLKPAIASLGYFVGDWECSGKFDSSGKAIEAHQHFAADLEGAAIGFRHDDKPPFNYHSAAQWGWDESNKEFVMTVLDSGGGIRLFRSNGWNSRSLQWEGDAIGSMSPPSQRFSFERLDDRQFKISYFTMKNGDWSRVDSSTCSKQ